MVATGGARGRRGPVLVAVLLPLAALGITGAPAASAALGGLTSFAIDGDTAGPDDWDDPPPTLLDLTAADDACGNGVLDPDQLDGRVDNVDLEALDPTPGHVTPKADLCRVWAATQAVPDGAGGFHVVLYGAWQRFGDTGEAYGYWPLVGPAPGNADDYLVVWEDGVVEVQRWDGSIWVTAMTPGPGVVDVAEDVPGRPTFGEFALDLSALGLPGLADCGGYTTDGVFSRTGNDASAQLQDYVGIGPLEITACGSLLLTKATVPPAPSPPVTFGYLVDRTGALPVRPGEPSVSGDLTVPGSPRVVIEDVLGGSDFTLSEPSLPAGWTNTSTVCDVPDVATGVPAVTDVGGATAFTVVPGRRTTCTLTNVAPPTLTVVKYAQPSDGTTFTFDATRAPADALPSFDLSSGQSATIPVSPGDEVTVTEEPAAGWGTDVACVGDDEATASGGSATVSIDAGEQVVCLFVNIGAVDPSSGALLVAKAAPGADGTTFGFAVDGPGAAPTSLTLAPDAVALGAVVTAPEPGGSTYTIAETPTDGWQLSDLACRGPGATSTDLAAGTATVDLEPGQVAACLFSNEPVEGEDLASLTLTKHTVPGGGPEFDFRAPGLDPASFTLADGESRTFAGLRPGTYSVLEATALDWRATGECSNGAPVNGGRVVVTLEPGEDVTCDLTNTRQAALTLTKVAVPRSEQDFPFAVGELRSSTGGIVLDDDGDPTDDPENGRLPASVTAPALAPGVWTLTEAAVPGWSVEDLTCTGGTVLEADPESGSATVRLDPGESATCVFTNAADAGPTDPGTGSELANSGFPGWRLALLSALLVALGSALVGLSRRSSRGW